MKKKVISARLSESPGMRQARRNSSPGIRPGSATNRAGCGPLPPMAMGNGGSATAAIRKTITQRAGARRSHKHPAAASAAPVSPRQSSIIRKARIPVAGLEHDIERGEYEGGED